MASPLVGRPPTCLACVRRLASNSSSATGSTSISLTQVRGKKSSGRLKSQGVVIRLLQDIPQFGKEGSIFRADAGRMRNQFFPRRKAEYMTRGRFAELGLTKNDIGERDFSFRPEVEEVEEFYDDAVEAVAFGGAASLNAPVDNVWTRAKAEAEAAAAQALELDQVVPKRAMELMKQLIPEPMIFARRMIHITAGAKQAAIAVAGAKETPEPAESESKEEKEAVEDKKAPEPEPEKPAPVLTPLQVHRAKLQAEADKALREKEEAKRAAALEEEKGAAAPEEKTAAETAEQLEKERLQREKEAEELLKIYGSVTQQNIATAIKDRMVLDLEASRIHVQPEMVTFLGLEAGVDRVEKIGTFEIEVQAHVGKTKIPPVRLTIKVVPLQRG